MQAQRLYRLIEADQIAAKLGIEAQHRALLSDQGPIIFRALAIKRRLHAAVERDEPDSRVA